MITKISQFKKAATLALGLLLVFILLLPSVADAVEVNTVEVNTNDVSVTPPAAVNQPASQDLPLVNQPAAEVTPLVNQPVTETPPLTNQPVAGALAASPTETTGNVILDSLKFFGSKLNLTDTDPRIIAARLIKIFLSLISTIFLILILLGGFRWMLSGGDEERVGEAKKILLNAVIGLIVVLSAYSIVNFVVSAVVK
ncbi:MAG: pilin [Patescibacteria group bacterium]|jgi:hypothetical protein